MIATLRGELIQIDATSLVVEVGGVGIRVFVPARLRERLQAGQGVSLHTHLVVREDALTLYGFETRPQLELFGLLLGVDGVGPKVSLAVVSTLDLESIQQAVTSGQSEILGRVPGVGRKTAQKIVLYLQDRLKPSASLAGAPALSDRDGEVLAALTALGYSVVEAQTAIQSLPADAPDDVEERLRLALQSLAT